MSYNLLQSQEDLLVQLKSSVLDDDIVVTRVDGVECLSELFEYNVHFQAKELKGKIDDILGSAITITINSSENKRYINGIISDFTEGTTTFENEDYLITCCLTVRPKFWLLTLDQDCKIFQNKSTIDIIKSVLKDTGITDVSDKTGQCGKVKREYCVQYNESSFNFVSRLMEDAGISYFFIHEQNKHTLVLADSPNAYQKIEGKSDIDYVEGANSEIPLNRVFETRVEARVNSGEYATADYNYKTAQTKLLSELKAKWQGKRVYEYPGGFANSKEGDDISKLRVQAFEFNHSLLVGSSTVITFVPGALFSLNHYSSSFKGNYVLYSVKLFFESSAKGVLFHNEFKAFKKDVEFRPIRKTPKPRIYGTQTAIVMCPEGKEIYRNEFLAVKVRFYWDQYGKDADTCSCWLRVAQSLAGSGFGAIIVPRIDQEVVVSFINGDPDFPIVTGVLYNDQNQPPYPDSEAMKSTLKTVTFTDNNGFNEIRLNDEKDKEEIYVHAQKDKITEIENLRQTTIKESDDLLEIQKGSKETKLLAQGDSPGNYLLELTKGDKTEKLTEGNYLFEDTKGNMTVTLTEGDFTETLEKGNMTITLTKGDFSETLKNGNMSFKLDKGNLVIEIKGNYKLKLSGDATIQADGDITMKGRNISLKAQQAVKIESGMGMDLKAGTNMNCSANVNFSAKANVNAEMKGTVGATVEGTVTAKLSGTVAQVTGLGTSKITAPLVAIGGGMIQLG